MPRINHASSLIVEDHLKSMMSMTSGSKFWRSYENKLLPRAQHSCFGDFPKDMMPLNKTAFSPSPKKDKMAGVSENESQ